MLQVRGGLFVLCMLQVWGSGGGEDVVVPPGVVEKGGGRPAGRQAGCAVRVHPVHMLQVVVVWFGRIQRGGVHNAGGGGEGRCGLALMVCGTLLVGLLGGWLAEGGCMSASCVHAAGRGWAFCLCMMRLLGGGQGTGGGGGGLCRMVL
jgi:hypothetical protein